MLKEFQIENFKSIKEPLLFTMEADLRFKDHQEHLVKVNGNQMLKVASIYGPNGGGKSNILQALALPKLLLEDTYYDYPMSFANIFSSDKVIGGTYFFVNDEYEIGYSFKILCDIVHAEGKGFKPLFHFLSERMSYRRKNELNFKMLFQSTAPSNNTIINTMLDNNVVKSYLKEVKSITSIEDASSYNEQYEEIIKLHKNSLLKAFSSLDLKIEDIIIHHDSYYPIFLVRCFGTIKKELSLLEESKGTQKMFWILINVLSGLKEGKIFIADDMNAYLHPDLFKLIVDLYNSKRNERTQLIFNSHELYNLNSSVFRRDEIWFAYRNKNYITELFSLANYENYMGEPVSEEAKYNLDYLNGKYGAKPYIKKEIKWYE